MALLLNDPCDTLTAWSLGGTPTVVALTGRTGNGFLLTAGTSQRVMYLITAPNQTDTVTAGFWYYPTGFTAGWTLLNFYGDAGTTLHGYVGVDGSGNLQYRHGPSSVTPTGGSAFAINTWYYIEASFRLSDTVGAFTIKVDGVTRLTVTTADTKNGGTAVVLDQVWIQSNGSTSNWNVDDVYIRNDASFGISTTGVQLAQISSRALTHSVPDAQLAQIDLRALNRAIPPPGVRAAQINVRALDRSSTAPAARLAQVSARVLSRLGVTEGRVAQTGVRSLVSLAAEVEPPPTESAATRYRVFAFGMTSSGTVIASIPANVATAVEGNALNQPSTSTDNQVTYVSSLTDEFIDEFERAGPELGTDWLPWPELIADYYNTDTLHIASGAATVTRHDDIT